MAYTIRRADYYYATITEEPGSAYTMLAELARLGVNLLAFTGVPVGPLRVQLGLFPDEPHRLEIAAQGMGLPLDGPHRALLVQGDDELGALASIHCRLADAGVNVYASSGVTDGRGSFGYVLYVRPDDIERALVSTAL